MFNLASVSKFHQTNCAKLSLCIHAYALTLLCSDSGRVLPLRKSSVRIVRRQCSEDNP